MYNRSSNAITIIASRLTPTQIRFVARDSCLFRQEKVVDDDEDVLRIAWLLACAQNA
jgi:hypothetical protein